MVRLLILNICNSLKNVFSGGCRVMADDEFEGPDMSDVPAFCWVSAATGQQGAEFVHRIRWAAGRVWALQ